jgi:uncharacterized SAM-binding protein YcdF (DUF218 family)
MTDTIRASDNAIAKPDRSRWWQQRPSWTRVVVAVAVVLVGYFLITLVQVVNAGRGDDARDVDAIVVLGAAQYDGRPSPQLAARLDHALLLWDEGIAPYVMVTGGKIPGDRFTEAESSRRYLIERGVPEEAMLMENTGRTTFESLEAASEVLSARGLVDVVLVTDPFHAHRSRLTAGQVGLTAYGSPTDTSVVKGWTSARRHVVEAAGVAVGRIVGFDRLSGL